MKAKTCHPCDKRPSAEVPTPSTRPLHCEFPKPFHITKVAKAGEVWREEAETCSKSHGSCCIDPSPLLLLHLTLSSSLHKWNSRYDRTPPAFHEAPDMLLLLSHAFKMCGGLQSWAQTGSLWLKRRLRLCFSGPGGWGWFRSR